MVLQFGKTLLLTRINIIVDDGVIFFAVVAAGALKYAKEKFVLLCPRERAESVGVTGITSSSVVLAKVVE